MLLLSNFAATLFMVGLIWMVQIVHYPLFQQVGTENYSVYQMQHQNRITLVVGPVMLVELLTSVLLVWYGEDSVDHRLLVAGLLLVVVIWLSTALLQVPCHEILTKGFEPDVHRRLVQTNWIRTIAWTMRGILLFFVSYQAMQR